ncbi:filament-like plant protein 1 [Vigna unguiculata]|uniref:filament-like plant protein 1 n=1 Tax=Vigna unguiculata TaxID=3917 RepID=UPI001016B538|nr:filament-like plant protein 1 [Vigna unguiculata]XP_027940814.1 filament-like plant protein 1 [Vigna unguiculata]XP_027940815.1 filament-like plant protein 1 [Vigna unguiculata]
MRCIFEANIGLLDPMMDKKRWLWKRKSSEKSPDETESSGSVSSHSGRYSDEQEALKESPSRSNHSPDVTSKATVYAEAVDYCSFINEQLPEEVTSKTVPATGIASDDSSEKDENGENENIKDVKEDVLNDGLRNMSEKLSAALVNVNAKEDYAKVAEEAIAGWEKAEKEVAVLKKQLDTAILRNSFLEDRVTHLDGALKECVRQLSQTIEEQEESIYDAVAKKTQELESAKIKLESKLTELQKKLDASEARSSIDFDMYRKVEYLEKENMTLKHEIFVQSEELEIRTIERDLSTQAAETASKQHLESIKKVAKLEAECRRLRSVASKASLVNDHKSIVQSSFSVESLTDSQSDSAERHTAVEIEGHKMNGSEPNRFEPSCSDSWASALIAELDQFKNEKCRQTPSCSVKLDLMDDFLEMERLVALPETKKESLVQESVVINQSINKESSLSVDFEIMIEHIDELKEKLEKVEADKAELQIALMKSEEIIEESQLQLKEAGEKLEELQRELENAYNSKQRVEDHLLDIVTEAQTLSVKVEFLESEVDKERAVSGEIAMKFRDLEEELERKSAEVNTLEAELDKKKAVSNKIAMKCKDLEKELENKSDKVDLLEAEVGKEREESDKIAKKLKGMEQVLDSKSAKVDVLEAEVAKQKDVSDKIAKKCKDLEEVVENKSAKVELLEAEVDKERTVSDKISLRCKDLEEKLESKSAKVDLLEEEVHKERTTSKEIAMKCRKLEDELLRSTASSYGEKKIKQEDLALAAGKLAECQKTIASLGNQLKSLATLEDFLIDTASIPASPSLIAQAGGEMWKLHSNGTFSPKRDSISSRLADGSSCSPLNKNEETSPLSSSSSTSSPAMPNHVSSERSRNGFAKFFSRTKSGIRLQI